MEIYPRDTYIPKERDQECVFCTCDTPNLLWKGKYFFIQHAKYPYCGLEKHLLVIPYAHKLLTKELTPEEYSEFSQIEKFMDGHYKGGDYFSFIRQTISDNSRSVDHLHFHYLPGYIDPNDVEDFLRKQFN